MGRTGLTRRRVLAAATAATAPVGCSGPGSGGGDRPGASRPSAAERARRAETILRRRSAAVSGVLLAGCDEVLGAHPALGSRVAPLREVTARHLAALEPRDGPVPGTAPPAPAGGAAPGAAGAPSPAPRPFPEGVPAAPGAALGELAALASRTAAAHTAALVGAPPELARLLASVAAAGAAQAFLLGAGGRG